MGKTFSWFRYLVLMALFVGMFFYAILPLRWWVVLFGAALGSACHVVAASWAKENG